MTRCLALRRTARSIPLPRARSCRETRRRQHQPWDLTQLVLGVQETGLFTLDFLFDFSGGTFNAAASSFSITKIQNHNNDTDGLFGDADNVDWTAPATLGSTTYPDGLIFVNEDSGTANGESWMPVSIAYRVGEHSAAGVCACVNIIPSRASRSTFGVPILLFGL